MAKAKFTSATKTQAVPERIVQEIGLLATRIQTVICTAICVEFALQHQNGEYDREFAQCVKRNVVDELYRSREQAQKIYRDLGGRPFPGLTEDEE